MCSSQQGWRSVRLADAGQWLSGGTPSTANQRYWDGDIPWISAASLKAFDISDSDRRITRAGALAGSRLVPKDTVLFVVRGMSLKNEFRVGVTCRKVAFGQDCKAILPTADIDARFLAYALRANSNNILRMVDEAGHGTGRLPTDQLAALRVGIPTLAEQRRVVEILDAVGDGIHAGTSYVAKLHVLWQGLMADLLTGRVQVKDAEELVEGEV